MPRRPAARPLSETPVRVDRRAHLVDTALRLFAAGGYHGVGIDTILATAGVAKKTLYSHFPSKTELIAEVLRERDRRFRASLEAGVAGREAPLERLQAVFEWHARWFAEPDFAGCMFLNVAAEFHAGEAGLAQIARDHKQALETFLAGLLVPLTGAEAALARAAEFNLLLDGAIGVALVSGDGAGAAARAWDMARRLLAPLPAAQG
ncbi:TetR/AcrR family transcriptional regulator [Zoogloea dura]|jgi:AcrR family transcriptional regulator|uniref:TetR/AcrR family transcriptional regulator n=1 Tax=Zoogloea dura TaxID=2728840 RepID=A0A848G2R7_9RHOO|nr:TetR/AcrR family transcriptional regulator [Zoogloea dura]NML25295.1 TetR/AcrR family transcriptional regulator [Zoogloea dura]